MSADGRYTVFTSYTRFAFAGQVDNNNTPDVFLYDRVSDAVTLVSHAAGSSARTGNGAASVPCISADGRFVAYVSASTDVVPGIDANGATDVFLWDRLSDTTVLVSDTPAAGFQAANGASANPDISGDGSVVVFTTLATDLGVSDGNGASDVFRWSAGGLSLLSHAAGAPTTAAAGSSSGPRVSGAGSRVVFLSTAANLVPGATDANGTTDVILWDQSLPDLTLVSDADPSPPAAVAANGASTAATISADGSRLAFVSAATNLAAADGNAATDVFAFDPGTGALVPASSAAGSPGTTANAGSSAPSVSADGRYVAYESRATNLVLGFIDGNGASPDVFRYDSQSGANALASPSTSSPSRGSNGECRWAFVAADGAVTFQSSSTDLVTGFSDLNGTFSPDVYRWASGSVSLLSHSLAAPATGGDFGVTLNALSQDGTHAVFESLATNLVAGDPVPFMYDVFLHEVATSVNRRPSSRLPSATATGGSFLTGPDNATSRDGRFTVFYSDARDLLSSPTGNSVNDVYIHDRSTGQLSLVSHSTLGPQVEGNGPSQFPVISADGSFVAFESFATDLVPGFVDANGPSKTDLFLWERATGTITLVSHSRSGLTTTGDDGSSRPALAEGAGVVAFESNATDLVDGFVDNNGALDPDLFVYDRGSGGLALVSHAFGSAAATGDHGAVGPPEISADGTWVAFGTWASDIVPGDTNSRPDAFLYHRPTGSVSLVSHVPGDPGTVGDGEASYPRMSADGGTVCFVTSSTNLGFTDANNGFDVVVWNRASDTFSLVSHAVGLPGTAADRGSVMCALSANGRWVAFQSQGRDLVAGFTDLNGPTSSDLFLYERATGEVRLLSHAAGSATAGSNAAPDYHLAVSDAGDQVAFESDATNLVAGFVDNNGPTTRDAYLYRRNSGLIELVSRDYLASSIGGSGMDGGLNIAHDGDRVIHSSFSENLVSGDRNSRSDVFLYSSVCSADGLSATPAGNNAIALAWTAGTPPFEVKRALAPGGPYQVVGNPPTMAFTDTTAQGGVTYYYLVANGCGDSNEVAASTTGACQLAPSFAGAASATQSGATTCTVQVSWPAASAPCGGSLSYAVYRSPTPGFTPDVTHRLAANLPGLSYTDTAGVASGVPLYYVVRATDGGNGEEDLNLVERSVLPTSCTASAPPPVGVLTVRAEDRQSRIEWINPAGFANARVGYRSDGVYPTDPGDPLATFLDYVVTPGAASRDDVSHATNGTFKWRAFVDAGSSLYSGPLSTQGRTFDTSGNVKWAYSTNATALATAGVLPGTSYHVVSNDRFLHGLAAGVAGGSWPQGPPEWKPFAMNAPSQSRPTAVRLSPTTVSGESHVLLVGSQDGRVYALSARTGGLLWASPVLGAAVQGGVSAIFRDFGAAYDLVIVGTREPTGDSRLVALRLADGTIAWSFDNGGGPNGIGVVNGQPAVDQAANRAWFASRRRGGGSAHTVWCLSFTGGSATKVWSVDVGEVDGSVVVRNGVLYAGNTAGQVYALDPADGSVLWGPVATGDGAVKGLVWPETGTGRLFFSTTGQVHGWNADGSPWWSAPVSLPNVSPVLVVGGKVYVGSSAGNGSLWAIDTSSAATTFVPLGDPLVPKVVGAPTRDSVHDSIVVGTDAGQVYDVALPLP